MSPTSSFISIIISTSSTVIALIMLFMTRRDMNRREQKDQEMFIDHVYEQFQEQKLAMLQDPASLKILSDDRGKSVEETKRDSLASIRINQAYRLFRLSQKKYLTEEQWEQLKSDVQFMFTLPSIKSQWTKIQGKYPEPFRKLVNDKL